MSEKAKTCFECALALAGRCPQSKDKKMKTQKPDATFRKKNGFLECAVNLSPKLDKKITKILHGSQKNHVVTKVTKKPVNPKGETSDESKYVKSLVRDKTEDKFSFYKLLKDSGLKRKTLIEYAKSLDKIQENKWSKIPLSLRRKLKDLKLITSTINPKIIIDTEAPYISLVLNGLCYEGLVRKVNKKRRVS